MGELTEKQRARVGALAEAGATLHVIEVPPGSVILTKETARGFWFEVAEPEATLLHAWDIPRGAA